MQSLLGPGSEPVDGGIVDQSRKVTTASPQCLPDRRHAEHNVEVVGGLLHKVGPAVLPGREKTRLLHLFPYLREGRREGRKGGGEGRESVGGVVCAGMTDLSNDGFFLVIRVEGRNHARRKHVVDEL